MEKTAIENCHSFPIQSDFFNSGSAIWKVDEGEQQHQLNWYKEGRCFCFAADARVIHVGVGATAAATADGFREKQVH